MNQEKNESKEQIVLVKKINGFITGYKKKFKNFVT